MISPHLSAEEKALTEGARQRVTWISDHIWIASSGSTRREGIRWVGLSKKAFLCSAKGVNRHLQVNKLDVWLNVLPLYHVGGLAIHARSHLSGCRVIELSRRRWLPRMFVSELEERKVTIVSLVPTQIFDLIRDGRTPPRRLRAVLAGGGALDPALYTAARKLGWPILPSYGMTECCSTVAAASLESLSESEYPRLHVLPHVRLESRDGRIAISSGALADYSLMAHPQNGFSLEDPKREGWLLTEDVGEAAGGIVEIRGRMSERVKVLGELVSVLRVEEELRNCLRETVCVLPIPHPRKGHALIAVVENPESLRDCKKQIDAFHRQNPSLWRLDHWYAVDQIPRSALGKFLKPKLQAFLGL